jgi:hypothetical protein
MHRPSLRKRKKSKQGTKVIRNHLPAASAEAFKDLSAKLHVQLHVGRSFVTDSSCVRLNTCKMTPKQKVLASRQECKDCKYSKHIVYKKLNLYFISRTNFCLYHETFYRLNFDS